ncbi:MAG: FprA family A-type flavoprotein [Anaerolineaceae bacterium]|nr:FprA family A-type flavoprotein [Anaerolineaceae bacterium]
MNVRKITDRVSLLGVIDWDRTLFDALIPLPEGTTYNAYLVEGSEKTVLLDTVDPEKSHILMNQLKEIEKIDYIVSHHAEQDHSGTIPLVLEKYPEAILLTSEKGKSMLLDLLTLPEARIRVVADGEEVSLGDRTLKFIYTPWVHWPETMSTYLVEQNILFSCDFFGAHFCTSEMFADEKEQVLASNKRYFAEIMYPFSKFIKKNLEKIEAYDIDLICPSHGPLYNKPEFIINAYKEWVSDTPKNLVVLPYVSMHHSTSTMVEYLMGALVDRGIQVQPFNLEVSDIGMIAMHLVDAATVIYAAPTVLGGPHPLLANIIEVTKLLKPKAKHLGYIGSYGWGNTTPKKITDDLSQMKVEILPIVNHRGHPSSETYVELDRLADLIQAKHQEAGIL